MCFMKWFRKTFSCSKSYHQLGYIFVMASHCCLKYLFFVIIVFGITHGVDKPTCNFSRNFIEPSGTANVPLTKEWFIWGRLLSYCLQVRWKGCMIQWLLNILQYCIHSLFFLFLELTTAMWNLLNNSLFLVALKYP